MLDLQELVLHLPEGQKQEETKQKEDEEKTLLWRGDEVLLTVSFSPLVFVVSHLFAGPSGSFPFHDPAEMRGSGPPQLSPLAPSGKLSLKNLPS